MEIRLLYLSGLSWKCLEGWKLYMSLAFPGMLMLCLEWWSFEVLVFLAGTLGTTSLAAHSILYQMAAIMFMTPLGLAQSACVRVGNLLGEGLHQMAANSAHVIVSFTFFIAIFDAILLCSFKDLIPLCFTQDRDVIDLTSNLLLILAVFHVADALEGVASGVLRGTGQQRFGAVVNLIAYYIVGLPIAIVLIFYTSLGTAGAWWGICFGSTFQCISFFIKISFLNWVEESKTASLRAGVKTTKIDGVQDECTVSEGEDNQQLIEADHLLLTESPSLNSINSNDTEYMESEYNRKRRLILIRLIPFVCCLIFLIIGIVIHEYLKEFTAHQHCVLMHGHDFNLTYIHELLMDPQEHNLTKNDVDMLNTTYYFESQNFGNQTFIYCPHNVPDFYHGDYEDFNQTKLYKLFYPRLTFHPLG
ncbi:multidrug and toxin extrusion protein 1 [Patella vulgata]|uniref:multidrug and toxin extrusion protein 1 n=1 Tax=Patella vulgata TaxID=6465 RepID=UPI0024A7EF2F|nr:multidrug and toxin extrusion protein 1 [Patella vulgata]